VHVHLGSLSLIVGLRAQPQANGVIAAAMSVTDAVRFVLAIQLAAGIARNSNLAKAAIRRAEAISIRLNWLNFSLRSGPHDPIKYQRFPLWG